MTLLSLFCSSLRKSLASTLSWKRIKGIHSTSLPIPTIPTVTAGVETYVFASHGLEHLLQLNPELLDVIDNDTRLREREKDHYKHGFIFKSIKISLSRFYCFFGENPLGDIGQEFSVITAPLGALGLSGRAAHFSSS